MVRGKGFSTEEDEALCRAFLLVSKDEVVGTTSAIFWQRVYEKWVEFYVADTGLEVRRQATGLESRFKSIKKGCNKYAARIAQAKRCCISGFKEADIVLPSASWSWISRNANPAADFVVGFASKGICLDDWFNHPPAPSCKIEKANASFKRREKIAFGLHHCWRYLKDAINWKIPIDTDYEQAIILPLQVQETEEVQNSPATTVEEPQVLTPTTNPNQGLAERKAAERKVIEEGQTSDMAEQLRRFNNIMEAEVARKKDKDKYMKLVFEASSRRQEENADLEYLKIDTSFMAQEQREFFEQKKTEIFKKLRSYGSDSSTSNNPSADSQYSKFREEGISPNMMDRMCKGTTAMGQFVKIPSADIDLEEIVKVSDESNMIPIDDEEDLEKGNEERGTKRTNEYTKSASRKGKGVMEGPKGKKGKVGGAVKLSLQIDRLVEIVESRSIATSNHASSQETSIQDVMRVVATLPGVRTGTELWWFATDLFCSQEKREMFLVMTDPDLKLQYLKLQYLKLQHS